MKRTVVVVGVVLGIFLSVVIDISCAFSSSAALASAAAASSSSSSASAFTSSISILAAASSSSSSQLDGSSYSSSSSSSSSIGGDAGIKIVGLPGGQVQSLPGMYVKSFQRWIVEGEIERANDNNNKKDVRTATVLKAIPIMGCGTNLDSSNYNYDDDDDDDDYDYNNNIIISNEVGGQSNNNINEYDTRSSISRRGWVNPTSTNQLWWPRDLPTLQIRPMLNVLFRNGVLSYVSVGLDVRVPHYRGNDDDAAIIITPPSNTNIAAQTNVSTWRNHGMNSQPIARQWTTLDIAMEKLFHVEGFIVFGGDDDENANDIISSNDDEEENVRQLQTPPQNRRSSQTARYDTLFPSLDVQDALQKVARFAAELDSSSPLALGFHIASIPMTKHWIDLPAATTSEANDNKKNDETEIVAYKIVCMATSEPFGSKLLDLDEDLLTITSSSVLEVDVSRIAPGGESIYLTKPYRELYLGEKSK